MARTSDILELSRIISANSEVINSLMKENNISLSSTVDGTLPTTSSCSTESTSFEAARMNVCNAAARLVDLLSRDEAPLLSLWSQYNAASAMRIACTFGFARAVPLESSTTYEDVAAKVSLDQITVQRVIGVLIPYNVFYQPSPGHVSHSRFSYLMATNDEVASLASFVFDEMYTASCHMSDALQKWGPSKEVNQVGFNIAQGFPGGMWEYLEQKPGAQERFAEAMRCLTSFKTTRIDGLFHGYNWKDLEDGVVIDVGGSFGHVSMELAKRYPKLRFIIQDNEEVCRRGKEILPSEFQGRITFQPHNMFEPQAGIPDKRVVFFLRTVIHDWPDAYAARILRALVSGMKQGDCIVLNEQVLPEPANNASLVEKFGRSIDLNVMSILNGKERTAAQFHTLAADADPRLYVVDTTKQPDMMMGTVVMALREFPN